MRMDQQLENSARDVLNSYPEEALHRIFGMYGEVSNARTLARNIVLARIKEPLEMTAQLKAILTPLAKRGGEHKYFAQVFPALRIEGTEEDRKSVVQGTRVSVGLVVGVRCIIHKTHKHLQ